MDEKTYFILGRQPALGFAELESIFGAISIRKVQPGIAEVNRSVSPELFQKLGGSMKMARLLNVTDSTDWIKIVNSILKKAGENAQLLPEGKLTIGLSVYGLRAHVRDINSAGIALKKAIRQVDPNRSIRIVPNKEPVMSSPQVIHNDLTGPNGWELVFIKDGGKTIIALTEAEQNIEAYGARDQARPARDAKVGMLPPKLAQILVNIAVADTKNNKSADKLAAADIMVLDPFCGTGVVLQEALLMGYDTVGTDLEPRMIEYSTKNITWLRNSWKRATGYIRIEVGDATHHQWPKTITHVAGETYLGRPMIKIPAYQEFDRIVKEVDDLHYKFFKNIAKQIPAGTRLCMAVPAWKTQNGFTHLPVLEKLSNMGYNHVEFVHAAKNDLIYHRTEQIVARELVILVKQ